jgi:hypothetical protein
MTASFVTDLDLPRVELKRSALSDHRTGRIAADEMRAALDAWARFVATTVSSEGGTA